MLPTMTVYKPTILVNLESSSFYKGKLRILETKRSFFVKDGAPLKISNGNKMSPWVSTLEAFCILLWVLLMSHSSNDGTTI